MPSNHDRKINHFLPICKKCTVAKHFEFEIYFMTNSMNSDCVQKTILPAGDLIYIDISGICKKHPQYILCIYN